MTSGHTVFLNHELGAASANWDVLNTRLNGAHPMLDSRFVNVLLKHFGDGSEQLCIIGSDVTPSAMCVLRTRGLGVWSTFLPSQTQVGPALLASAEDARNILSVLPHWPLQVDFLCQDPKFSQISDTGCSTGSAIDHALTINIHLEGGFDNYWAGRPKKLIQNIARYRRRLLADGVSPRFACISSSDEIETAVNRYALLEAAGWKGQAGTALTVNNPQGAFYRNVMKGFAQTGQAAVFELWFGDRLAASRLVISNESMMIMLKTTYDEGLSQYAPGRLLLHDLIQFAFESRPGGTIEFYTDATEDQISWATGQRWIRHISIYRSESVAQMLGVAKYFRQSLCGRSESNSSNGWSVESYSHPDEFPQPVKRFVEVAEAGSIELGVVWYRNLIQTVYSTRQGVAFHVLKNGELPMAVLPVCACKRPFGRTLESLSNYYSSIYSPIFSETLKTRDAVRLLEGIKGEQGAISVMRFAPLDPESRNYKILKDALQLCGYIPFSFFCFGNWYLNVLGDWSGYWSGREGILRNTVRRMERKFQKEGGEIEIVVGGVGVEPAIQAFQQVYSASWKRPEPYPEFVPGLIRACAEKGWLRLGIARLNGVPVAAEIWIVAYGKAEIYKLAYHEDYKSYSPGKLLTAFLMRHVIDADQVKEVDYLIGDDPHKQFWMSHRRERWGIVAYSPGTLMGALGLLREVLGRLAKNYFPGVRGRLSAKNVD